MFWWGGIIKRPEMIPWFNIRKAAQVAAFFARAEGGRINVLKLIKLIYLADRKHLEDFDWPILNDKYVSMAHGPVNSIAFDYINGCQLERDSWELFVTDRDHYDVGVAREDISDDELDELSKAELKTLNQVWGEFGGMTKYQIRDWTHDNLPEWEDPEGSSSPIPYERILKFLGKAHAAELDAELTASHVVSEMFTHP